MSCRNRTPLHFVPLQRQDAQEQRFGYGCLQGTHEVTGHVYVSKSRRAYDMGAALILNNTDGLAGLHKFLKELAKASRA